MRSKPDASQRVRVRGSKALEPLLHENPRGTELPVDHGDSDSRTGIENCCHVGHGLDLTQEVELGSKTPCKMGEYLAGSDAAPEGCATFGQVSQPRQSGEVTLHDQRDTWSLDFYDDRLTGMEPRPISLRDRRRRQRIPIEFSEDLRCGTAELRL